ncbi:MAG: ABC transporter permease [Eubacteriales bacterium]|nr:ABC transporter permease [Eubacteriales bacterium]
MIALFKRNLKVFLRDRSSVFFSLLSVFIIIGLYALFLGDLMLSSDIFQGRAGVKWMMDSWLMAGVMAAGSVTTALGAMGLMAEDKERKINMDFVSSPVKRGEIVGGYILSGYVISVLLTLVTGVLATMYIVARGGQLPGLATVAQAIGLLLLSGFSSTALVLLLVSFMKSSASFSIISTLVGTLIGFLAGVYVPVGQLPGAVANVVNFIPASHSSSLLRQVMMAEPASQVFAGAPGEMVMGFRRAMGVDLYFGGTLISPAASLLVLFGSGTLFFALATLNLRRKKK